MLQWRQREMAAAEAVEEAKRKEIARLQGIVAAQELRRQAAEAERRAVRDAAEAERLAAERLAAQQAAHRQHLIGSVRIGEGG